MTTHAIHALRSPSAHRIWSAHALLVSIAVAGVTQTARAQASARTEVPFTIADSAWNSEQFGNHRAVVQVRESGAAARVTIPWRRRDRAPETRGVIVVDHRTGRAIPNVRRGAFSQHSGTLDFQPVSGPGRYDVYYLPYVSGGRSNYPNVKYLPVTPTADTAWIATATAPVAASVLRIEAVDTLNRVFPMEVVATPAEVSTMIAAHRDAVLLVFPEDRRTPIRMPDQLPHHWTVRGPGGSVVLDGRRGEFVAFQLGIYAVAALDSVTVTLQDLVSVNGARIPASAMTVLNTGGIGWDGVPFAARVNVPAGRVQAMWGGVQVPVTAMPGEYRGNAIVAARGVAPTIVPMTLTLSAAIARDGGVHEPELQTRLPWLNSTRGQRNDVIAPYRPLRVVGSSIHLLGRRVALGTDGLPARIDTYFTPEMTGTGTTPNPILAAPMRFEIAGGPALRSTGVRFLTRQPGTVIWESSARSTAATTTLRGELEFDGYLRYRIVVRALRDLQTDDIRLLMPMTPAASTHMLGLGLKGQRRPATLEWAWDVAKKNQDGAWIGGVNAGLWFSLRSENYVRPLNTNFYLQKPLNLPTAWGNGGRGGIRIAEADGQVQVRAFSGPRLVAAGDSLVFDAHFLITPFHAIDTEAQWSNRFYHRFAPVDTIKATGATVINVHHANAINPYINYPFIAHQAMKAYIDEAHAKGLQVKIYNTVRELSNRAWETFPLQSLGHEIYTPGQGGGYSWLQEHFGDDYIAAWFVPELKDAAIINSGRSRWHNYYVEGINWLVRNVGIDGLYLDDVAFDRTTMKRVKRMLTQQGRPGIIDLHSANQYNERDGFQNSAVLYLEHFPYVNRLWFGEYFDYEKNSADFFLTEVSGIPFGLMGEMLEKGGNPWRGMLYGMTNRMPWSAEADPRPIWALWDRFGMKGSTMLGYWSPNAPVRADRDDVLVTTYTRPGRALLAIASWAPTAVTTRLIIDWRALGIDPGRATIVAEEVRGLQAARRFEATDAIPVEPNKGWMLVIREEGR